MSQAGEARSARIESLRALAALAVLVNHAFGAAEGFGTAEFSHRIALAAGLGVFLFFTLSGYLLFLPFARRDYGSGRSIELRGYALNRALRILPLYWVAVVVLLIAGEGGGSGEQWWRFGTLTQSFYRDSLLTVDGPMWSLAVELQFYALLPLLAWALAKSSRGSATIAAGALAVLAALSLALWYEKVHLIDPGGDERWRYSLPVTFLAFVPGMLIALARARLGERAIAARLPSAPYLLAASLLFWLLAAYRLVWAEPCAVIASSLVLAAVVGPAAPGRLLRALDWKPLAALGVASYSLYLWHKPLLDSLEDATGLGFVPLLAIALPLCFAVAAASYLSVERPFLRLRRRWS